MNTVEKIENLMNKYNLEACKEAWTKKNQNYSANVAFLGSFSSGKTSLINMLLGTKLPVKPKPTTKAICFITPNENVTDFNILELQDEKTLEKRVVDALEFDECLCGDKNGVAYVSVKPNDMLPKGTVFVDTPGEGSLSDESALTISYLQNVDASVFCISVEDGCVQEPVAKFICSRFLTNVHPYFIFAITMTDLKKNPEAQENVRRKIVEDLKALAAAGKFNATDIEDRVVMTTRDDPKGTQKKIFAALEKFVFANLKQINDNRLSQNGEEFKVVVKEALEDLLENMSLDINEQRIKQESIEERKNAIKKDIGVCKDKMLEFKNELPDALENAFEKHVGEFLDASDITEYKSIGQSLSEDISANVDNLFKRKFGNVENMTPASGFSSKLAMELPHLLQRVNKWTSFASDVIFNGIVIAASAGAAGAVSGGLTAAGGAAHGAGAAVAKDVAKEIAKGTAKEIAKGAAKKAVKEVAKEVAKEPGKLSKACSILANVLDRVNFVKPLAELVGDSVKENKIKEFKRTFVDDFSCQIGFEFERQINDVVIEPLKIKIKNEEVNLKNVDCEIDKASAEYLQRKNELKSDIAGL